MLTRIHRISTVANNKLQSTSANLWHLCVRNRKHHNAKQKKDLNCASSYLYVHPLLSFECKDTYIYAHTYIFVIYKSCNYIGYS